MIKYLILTLWITSNLFSWSLLGTRVDKNISDLNLSSKDALWAYQDGAWKTTQNLPDFTQLQTIKGGEGFWSKYGISLPQSTSDKTIDWKTGWNLVSPINSEWNISEKFDNNDSVNFAWAYQANAWRLYSKKDDNYGYAKFTKLSFGEGAWVYYAPATNLYFGSIPIYCKNGTCSKIATSDTSFLFKVKTDTFNKDLKIGFDLYRYSNDTHYKFAFGPFEIQENKELLQTPSIPVCVEKDGTSSSCKKIANTTKFAYYQDGYLLINSQKIASLFNKSIPAVHENFKLKLFISGFYADGFINSEDFGTIGIENFGIWVSIKDDKAVSFDVSIE